MKDRENTMPHDTLQCLVDDTAEALDAWTDAALEDLEAAEADVSAGERSDAVRFFEERSGRIRRSPRRSLTAAAMVLLVGLSFGFIARGFLPERGDGGRLLLGEQPLFNLTPHGEVDRYTRFTWSTSEDNALFGLRVRNEGEPDAVISVDGLTEPSYLPSAAELERLGPRIDFQVLLQTPDGGTRSSALVSASRRSD
jgi:hypothetical protein